MSMAIVGIAGTVIGAGASIYSTQAANKRQQQAGSASMSGLNLGRTPEAAEYKPVDFTGEQWAAINGNLRNMHEITGLMDSTNIAIDNDAMKRAMRFVPGYKQMMRQQSANAGSLLNGQLPYDDVMEIVADRGSLTNAMGTPGTGGGATMRDLGLSRLDAMKTGSSMMSGMVDIAERINPVSRRMTPQAMFMSPTDRIRMAIEQNSLIQQSEQNANNLEAGVSPTESAAAQLALAQRLGTIGGGGTDITGYASALNGLISGLGAAYKGTGTGGVAPMAGSTYSGSFPTNPVPGTTNQIYRPPQYSIPA